MFTFESTSLLVIFAYCQCKVDSVSLVLPCKYVIEQNV